MIHSVNSEMVLWSLNKNITLIFILRPTSILGNSKIIIMTNRLFKTILILCHKFIKNPVYFYFVLVYNCIKY